ncbi:hypothetical protein PRZ48_005402 [Zasmidium cellare]|uniref:Uncharacterized protein n=1 Tax=Zasmidium cellare TaxID=395010 RepID=A0ABR0ETR4_ZASCE|nr:hypothetical protein PRZ48_005402 [Zasmidium cellare]
MNSQIQNILIMVSAILASTQIPLKDPSVLAARTIYISINLAVLAILAYVRLRIAQVKDTTIIPSKPSEPNSKTPSPSQPSTVQTHDLHHLHILIKSQLTSMAIVALMHLYFKLPTPLLIQSILPVKNALESHVVKVYVLGRPAVGELGRPWEERRGLMEGVRGLFGKGVKESEKKSQ